MSKVDRAWLRMEKPTNLMMITGVFILGGSLDYAEFTNLLAEKLLSYRRFRQNAVNSGSSAYWILDPDFDIRNHVRRTALPGRADRAELQDLVSELASTPLDQSKPLWQFHHIDNYADGDVLICRMHHCIADGVALIQVLLSLTDMGEKGAQPASKSKRRGGSIFQRLVAPAQNGFAQACSVGNQIVEFGLGAFKEPERLQKLVAEGAELLGELGQAVTLSDDPKTLFKGRLSARKCVGWCDPIPLHEVKAISKALACTVNDVLISCVSGALRSYLEEKGQDPNVGGIRATVPVNLRPLEHAQKLGNHFGLVFLELPINEEDPLARLQTVHQRMHELKQSKQAAVSFGLLSALGMGPQFLQGPALDLLSQKATCVLTNVPGPQQPLHFVGTRIVQQMFWVPQTGNIGMGVSILSYDGGVQFGVITDRRLVPDPDQIIERFPQEFERLLTLTLLGTS